MSKDNIQTSENNFNGLLKVRRPDGTYCAPVVAADGTAVGVEIGLMPDLGTSFRSYQNDSNHQHQR
ncbi:MAG: hypothetical protein IPH35_17450 [Rhodoferax sp.]|nr:hypothetical protein [Rhodoferax sp.]